MHRLIDGAVEGVKYFISTTHGDNSDRCHVGKFGECLVWLEQSQLRIAPLLRCLDSISVGGGTRLYDSVCQAVDYLCAHGDRLRQWFVFVIAHSNDSMSIMSAGGCREHVLHKAGACNMSVVIISVGNGVHTNELDSVAAGARIRHIHVASVGGLKSTLTWASLDLTGGLSSAIDYVVLLDTSACTGAPLPGLSQPADVVPWQPLATSVEPPQAAVAGRRGQYADEPACRPAALGGLQQPLPVPQRARGRPLPGAEHRQAKIGHQPAAAVGHQPAGHQRAEGGRQQLPARGSQTMCRIPHGSEYQQPPAVPPVTLENLQRPPAARGPRLPAVTRATGRVRMRRFSNRLLHPGDRQIFASFARDNYPGNLPIHWAEDGEIEFLVLVEFDGRSIVGLLVMVAYGTDKVHIKLVVVHTGYRGRGLGTGMLAYVAKEYASKKITLNVSFYMPSLLKFYLAKGYARVEQISAEQGIMTLVLNHANLTSAAARKRSAGQ